MEQQLIDFLQNDCQLKGRSLKEVREVLQKYGYTDLQTFLELDEDYFKEFKLLDFQINALVKGIQDYRENFDQMSQNSSRSQRNRDEKSNKKQKKKFDKQIQSSRFEEEKIMNQNQNQVKNDYPQRENVYGQRIDMGRVDDQLNYLNLSNTQNQVFKNICTQNQTTINQFSALKQVNQNFKKIDIQNNNQYANGRNSIFKSIEFNLPLENYSDIEMIDTSSAPKPSYQIQKARDHHILFYSQEDASSEYRMNKIAINIDQYQEFFQNIQDQQLQVIGFYGCFNTILKLTEVFLNKQIPNKVDFDEGICAFRNGNKLALIFKTKEQLYKYQNKTDSNHLIVTYLRYLIDVCKYIYAVFPESLEINPLLRSPYSAINDQSQRLRPKTIMPQQQVEEMEIPLAFQNRQQFDLSNYSSAVDYQKYISKSEFTKEVFHSEIKSWVYERDIYGESLSNLCIQYDYPKLRELIIENWQKNSRFFHSDFQPRQLDNKLKTILLSFVKQQDKQQFQTIISSAQDYYLQNIEVERQKIDEQTQSQIIQLHRQFIENDLANFLCSYVNQQLQEINLQEQSGVLRNLFSMFVKKLPFQEDQLQVLRCNDQCIQKNFFIQQAQKYGLIQSDYFQQYDFQIHHTLRNKIEQMLYNLNQQISAINLNNQQSLINRYSELRREILQQLFNKIDPFIIEYKENIVNKVNIEFCAINIQRDEKQEIQCWSINKQPYSINYTFNKETNGKIELKSLIFTNDNSGIVLFKNFPEGKSSIFYFFFQTQTTPIFTLLISVNLNSEIIVETNLKQWFMYDNDSKRCQIGRLSTSGKIEEGIPANIYEQVISQNQITEIKSACFMPFGDKIYFLNQDYNLFEYNWQSQKLALSFQKINGNQAAFKKLPLRPADPQDYYYEVQSFSDGKNLILISRKSIDIYNRNYELLKSIKKLQGFLFTKNFSDRISNYLVMIGKEDKKLIKLKGISATTTIENCINDGREQLILGNPIFDYLYQAFKKFGPHSDFIGCPKETLLYFIYQQNQIKEQDIISYFKEINFKEENIKPISYRKDKLDQLSYIFNRVDSFMDTRKLKIILSGRIAIHVATLENFNLMPLQNGFNISDQIAENLIKSKDNCSDLIQKIVDMIKFGIYESVFDETQSPVTVISIVGRQSSGKSYVMNRLFGTRFNVAATRCTDGIWMSIVEVYDLNKAKIFVVLDCEGLFSARRNEQEEIKLCLALSAVSDITILNQDKSFDRYLSQLFNNFAQCIGRLKGQKLFKGDFMILVRNTDSEEARAVFDELYANRLTLQMNNQDQFYQRLFNEEQINKRLSSYKDREFDDEIKQFRNSEFLQLSKKRWTSGEDFKKSFKIILAQILTDDDNDMNLHKIKMQCEHIFEIAIQMFFEGGNRFTGKESQIESHVQIENNNISVFYLQEQIKLEQHVDENQSYLLLLKDIIEKFTSQTQDYHVRYHNDWLGSLNQQAQLIIRERIEYILKYFRLKITNGEEFLDTIKTFEFKLRKMLETFMTKVQFCNKLCRSCQRLCNLNRNHKNDCNCETSHTCRLPCTKPHEIEQQEYFCVERYGHEGDHRCDQGKHRCVSNCKFENCKFICNKEYAHSEFEIHDCGNKHSCTQKCDDILCTRTCEFDSKHEHQVHHCGENRCIHKCQLCDKQCAFNNHFHQRAIETGDTQNLKANINGQNYEIYFHICDSEHFCQNQCSLNGICEVDYDILQKTWKNDYCEFDFNYFQPRESRSQCKIMIPQYQLDHIDLGGFHDCKIGNHRCDHKCPECKCFCNKEYGHSDPHQSFLHRNKEHSVFVSHDEGKISLLNDGKTREYKVGESCQPETCTSACQRKGRAHYHLKECQSPETCQARINQNVKHSTEKYYPFQDKVFDKWLCQGYWNSLDWEPPIQEALIEENSLCNFICCNKSHANQKSFCTKKAWHEDDHQFVCSHRNPQDANIIDAVIVGDNTASMGVYIEKSKDTIKRIMRELNTDGRSIKIAYVGYRDHPIEANDYVAQVYCDLDDEQKVLAELEKVEADKGGDGPEAVMDGLHLAINQISWRQNSMRFIFHITDAPPHGRQYHDDKFDNYPDGCPCGIKIEDLAVQLKEKHIKYKLLKVGPYPNIMAGIFSTVIEDYEEKDLDSQFELENLVSQILIQEIRSEEIDFMQDI